MNNILLLNTETPNEKSIHIASRVKARRLELNLTQEGLANRAGIKFAEGSLFVPSILNTGSNA